MSISDYQRRKQQTSGHLAAVGLSSSRLAQSHNDYQRRRSVSPFTSRESIVPSTPTQPATATAHTKYNFNGNLYLNPANNNNAKIVNSAKYSREVCSNLVHESKTSCASATLYAKNYNNKKQFASSEDLCSATELKSRKFDKFFVVVCTSLLFFLFGLNFARLFTKILNRRLSLGVWIKTGNERPGFIFSLK